MSDPRKHILLHHQDGTVELVATDGTVVNAAAPRSLMHAPGIFSNDVRRLAGDIRNVYVNGMPVPIEQYLREREQRHMRNLARPIAPPQRT